MRGSKAKQIRQELLPGTRQHTGVSRGTVMRSLTAYIQKQPNVQKPRAVLYLKPGTPRQVYQAVKRRIKRER